MSSSEVLVVLFGGVVVLLLYVIIIYSTYVYFAKEDNEMPPILNDVGKSGTVACGILTGIAGIFTWNEYSKELAHTQDALNANKPVEDYGLYKYLLGITIFLLIFTIIFIVIWSGTGGVLLIIPGIVFILIPAIIGTVLGLIYKFTNKNRPSTANIPSAAIV